MPLVTATLADLYLRQGHSAEAIAVLEALLRRSPGREDLLRRLDEARRLAEAEGTEPPPAVATARAARPVRTDRVARLERLLARVQQRRRRNDVEKVA